MYEKIAMRRREVESSNIKSIGHSYPRRLLEIEFKDGNIYRYKGVNHKTYRALMNAESKGKEFHKNIKYSYPYKKYKDKEGNKMNNKYEMLVKQAYEEIVGSFEKEASTAFDRFVKNNPGKIPSRAGYHPITDPLIAPAVKTSEFKQSFSKNVNKLMRQHPDSNTLEGALVKANIDMAHNRLKSTHIPLMKLILEGDNGKSLSDIKANASAKLRSKTATDQNYPDSFDKSASTALNRYLENHPEIDKWDVQRKLLNVKGKHRSMSNITSGAAEKFVLKAPTVGEQVRRMTKADNFGELRYLKAKKGLFPHTKFE